MEKPKLRLWRREMPDLSVFRALGYSLKPALIAFETVIKTAAVDGNGGKAGGELVIIDDMDQQSPDGPTEGSKIQEKLKGLQERFQRIDGAHPWLWLQVASLMAVLVIGAMWAGYQNWKDRMPPHLWYEVEQVDVPPWPCRAAGVGPADVLVQVEGEYTLVEICPTSPWVCEEHNLTQGAWVIRLNVGANDIWHVTIK